MELISTHMHSDFCGHAEGSVEQMMQASAEAGLTTVAMTEHYPLTAAMDPVAYISMPADRVDEYCRRVVAMRERFPQMEILLGVELDWLGDDEDRVFSADEFDRYDIVLGSVHYVDAWPFDDPAQRGHWKEVGVDDIWRRYFTIWCEACVSDAPFTVMAHPDLVKKFGYRPGFDTSPLYKQAAEAARAGNRMIELNTSGDYYDCKEVFPCKSLLEEFCHAGIPATVGTDAHDPAHVSRGIEKAYGLLYDAGYRHITVPTLQGDRRTIEIA